MKLYIYLMMLTVGVSLLISGCRNPIEDLYDISVIPYEIEEEKQEIHESSMDLTEDSGVEIEMPEDYNSELQESTEQSTDFKNCDLELSAKYIFQFDIITISEDSRPDTFMSWPSVDTLRMIEAFNELHIIPMLEDSANNTIDTIFGTISEPITTEDFTNGNARCILYIYFQMLTHEEQLAIFDVIL